MKYKEYLVNKFTFKRIFIFLLGTSALILLWTSTLRMLGYEFSKKEVAVQPTPSPIVTQTPTSVPLNTMKADTPLIDIPKSETTTSVNSDLILLNLKTDINYNQDAMNSLLTAVYNNPNGACSSIIAQESTQNHIYYMMLSFYNAKVAEYGQYRESIPGVDNSLNAFQNTLQIVKNQCAAVGYNIE